MRHLLFTIIVVLVFDFVCSSLIAGEIRSITFEALVSIVRQDRSPGARSAASGPSYHARQQEEMRAARLEFEARRAAHLEELRERTPELIEELDRRIAALQERTRELSGQRSARIRAHDARRALDIRDDLIPLRHGDAEARLTSRRTTRVWMLLVADTLRTQTALRRAIREDRRLECDYYGAGDEPALVESIANTLERPVEAFESETSVMGDWWCRTFSMSPHGPQTTPAYRCDVVRRESDLVLRKRGGGMRFEGSLHRLSDGSYFFEKIEGSADEFYVDAFLSAYLRRIDEQTAMLAGISVRVYEPYNRPSQHRVHVSAEILMLTRQRPQGRDDGIALLRRSCCSLSRSSWNNGEFPNFSCN